MKNCILVFAGFGVVAGCGSGGGDDGTKIVDAASNSDATAAAGIDAAASDAPGLDAAAAADAAGSDKAPTTDTRVVDAGPPPMLDPAKVIGRQQSGSRLKATWFKTGGGAMAFAEWHDTTLDIPCQFVSMSDGKTRCVPLTAQGSVNQFADDKCTRPVNAWVPWECPVQPYVLRQVPNVCPATYKMFHRKTRITSLKNYVWDAAGACQPAGDYYKDATVYELEEVSVDTYVEAALKPGATVNGLTPLMRVTVDGAQEFAGWQDATTKESCAFGPASDYAQRCLPEAVAEWTGAYFAEDTCKTTVAAVSSDASCTPKYIKMVGAVGCRTRTVISKAGDKVQKGYFKENGVCKANDNPNLTFYKVGEALPPESFVEARGAGVIPGDAQVDLTAFETPAGTTVGGFQDKALNVGCVPWAVGKDGNRRCLPAPVRAFDKFSDNKCKNLVFWAPSCGDANIGFSLLNESTCPWIVGVYETGAPYTGASFKLDATETMCLPGPAGTFTPRGKEILSTRFPTLTVVEP